MPVSKRDKKVSLTKTPKKGMELKKKLVKKIRAQLEKYNNLYVFSALNNRNGPLKEMHEEWKGSRIFFAKKKVMAFALGRTESDEVHENLHKLSAHIVGQTGLLFTDKPKEEVVRWFNNYSQMEFAKSNFVATETVTLPAGPLPEFSFSIEPHLRSLGLPTQLEKGKIVLREPHVVCTKGMKLKPEQARILKLLDKKMAEFKLALVCMWSKDGSFEKFKVPKELKVTPKKPTELSKQEAKTPQPSKENGTPTQVSQVSKQAGKSPKENVKTPTQITKVSKQAGKSPKENVKTPTQITQVSKQAGKSPKENVKTPTQITQLSKQAGKSPNENVKTPMQVTQMPKQAGKSPKEITKVSNSENKTPKQNIKTPKQGTPNQVSHMLKPTIEEPMEEVEEIKQIEKSPKVGKANLRRSMRTPRPMKRTPEQRKQSVKKLTESAKQHKMTPKQVKGTPKQASNKKVFRPQTQDVEMAE